MYICFMNLEENKIEAINRYLRASPVLKAYLFGSYGRGDADNESDIDLLVDLDYSQKIGLKFIQMKIDLEKLLKVKVDLVSSDGLSEYIKPLIENEKKLIYARSIKR
jgi:predicted nucleotidyltransferase